MAHATAQTDRRADIARAVRPAVMKAGILIARSLDDASAHAETALTGTLIDAPAGRPTASRVRRSKSIKAALSRLDELQERLAGPSVRSLAGLIRDAWEDALLDAWVYARSTAHPDDLNSFLSPPTEAMRNARTTLLMGHDARSLMQAPIDNAKRSLSTMMPTIATPTVNAKLRLDAIRTWRTKAAKSIGQAVGNAIYTGAYRQDVIAQRSVLRPELLHDDPTMPD